MKKILLLFILFTSLVSWGQSPEIITYPNGDKHFVVWYNGSGVNKTVTKRETYQQQNQGGRLQKVENYKNGQKHGVFQYYNSEGLKILEENYITDKLHGTRKSWNDNGRILSNQEYQNGKIQSEIKREYFYDTGFLKKESHYIGERDKTFLNGSSYEYTQDGVLIKEIIYEYDEVSVTKYFYDSGQIKEEIGPCYGYYCIEKRWYENGNLEYESDKNGTIKKYTKDGVHYTKENFILDISNMMDDLWDQGLLKYDCDDDELLTKNKMIMKINFTSLIRNLETDEVYSSLIDEIDTSSDYWDNELEKWWKKNRDECGITD